MRLGIVVVDSILWFFLNVVDKNLVNYFDIIIVKFVFIRIIYIFFILKGNSFFNLI